MRVTKGATSHIQGFPVEVEAEAEAEVEAAEDCEDKRRLIKRCLCEVNTKKDDNYECSQRTGGLSEPGDQIPLRFEVIADEEVRSGKEKGR